MTYFHVFMFTDVLAVLFVRPCITCNLINLMQFTRKWTFIAITKCTYSSSYTFRTQMQVQQSNHCIIIPYGMITVLYHIGWSCWLRHLKAVIWKPQGVQNAAAQLMTGTCKFDHITPSMRDLHWLPVHQRIIYKIAMLVNKCLRGLAPRYLAELCQLVVELAGRWHLRSAASSKLSVQRTASTIRHRNFAVAGPDIWNSLPTDLHLSSLSTATFARHLKAHLFRSTEWHMPAARLSFFKAALFISDFIIIIMLLTLSLSPFLRWACLSQYQNVSIVDFVLRVMEVVVITGAISCPKLQSSCYHQQTNTQLFTGQWWVKDQLKISQLNLHNLIFILCNAVGVLTVMQRGHCYAKHMSTAAQNGLRPTQTDGEQDITSHSVQDTLCRQL